jgi:hypothetical protein
MSRRLSKSQDTGASLPLVQPVAEPRPPVTAASGPPAGTTADPLPSAPGAARNGLRKMARNGLRETAVAPA